MAAKLAADFRAHTAGFERLVAGGQLAAGARLPTVRELSKSLMRGDAKLDRRRLGEGETLTEQGAEGNELYLLLDGVLAVEIDGEPMAEVGPGALLGERALLEGTRTATLRATTPARVVVVPADAIEESAMQELAASHRREE